MYFRDEVQALEKAGAATGVPAWLLEHAPLLLQDW